MNQKDNIELRDKIITHLCKRLHNCELSNNDLIAILEEIGKYGNIKTYADYGRSEGISYNGVLERIKTGKIQALTLYNVKLVIDNN